jgi:hypothetical protein
MRASRKAAFYEKEILAVFTGTEAVKNGVIDSTKVSANSDNRLVVQAGQVMVKEGNKVKPGATSGLEAANIVGILAHTIEFFGNADADTDEACAMFWFNAVFDTTKLLSYSSNAAAVKAALSHCAFQ